MIRPLSLPPPASRLPPYASRLTPYAFRKRREAGNQTGKGRRMPGFRFESLEIWEEAIELGSVLADIAEGLDSRKLFRYAEQLRAAGLSMSNNIAEGSGSSSDRDFRNFLNIARRSVFENANMILFYRFRGYVDHDHSVAILERLRALAARILAFSKTLH